MSLLYLTELRELDLPAAVLINLLKDLQQLLRAGPEPHRTQDLVQVVRREEILQRIYLHLLVSAICQLLALFEQSDFT